MPVTDKWLWGQMPECNDGCQDGTVPEQKVVTADPIEGMTVEAQHLKRWE